MTDRSTALRVLAALGRTPVGSEAVLVGSSGLFGFPSEVPALTEDVDISIPEPVVEQHGPEIVEALEAQGFEHEPGTATFLSADGVVFDLLDPMRLDDVRAGAQDAFLALGRDPAFADAGAEGYAPALRQAERGLERLLAILEGAHG